MNVPLTPNQKETLSGLLRDAANNTDDPDWKTYAVILAKLEGLKSTTVEKSQQSRFCSCDDPPVMHAPDIHGDTKPVPYTQRRHHKDGPDGFPCSCGKPVDDPIHFPHISP